MWVSRSLRVRCDDGGVKAQRAVGHQAVPNVRVLDRLSLVKRRAQRRRMGILAAQPAAHAVLLERRQRGGPQRARIGLDRQRWAARQAAARVVAGVEIVVDTEARAQQTRSRHAARWRCAATRGNLSLPYMHPEPSGARVRGSTAVSRPDCLACGSVAPPRPIPKRLAEIVDKTRIQPVGGAHAIEIMAIGIEWAAPLNETQLAALQKVYDGTSEIKEFLPQHAPIQACTIQHGAQFGLVVGGPQPQVVQSPQFVTQAAGFDLRRFEPSGMISWVTSIRPELLSCNCSVYDRWKNVRSKALSILRPFVNAALGVDAQISAIGLQYQDAFRLLDGVSPAVTKELFRQDCAWLPGHVFSEPSFWHCHQGWFSNGPDGRRLLNNVTTDISDVNGVSFARIGGQHRVFSTSFDATTALKIDASDIERILECLHDENKKVINGMLSDAALVAIGCSVGGA